MQKMNNNYLGLTAIFKNEAHYICEWLEYYLLMGVEHFYLYDNASTDNTVALLQPYIERGLVTLSQCTGLNMQMPVYRDAIQKYIHHTRWMIFCDLDEFLLPKKYNSIVKMVKQYDHYDQLLLRWLNFGDSGHISTPAGLTMESFLYREQSNIHLKPILKLSSVLYFFNMHIAMTTGISYTLPYEEAQCNHYIIKSYEEFFCHKAVRNADKPGMTCNGSITYVLDYFHDNNVNHVYDDAMLKFVPSIKRRLNRPLK